MKRSLVTALALLLLSVSLSARDSLRLPWVFSDQPELVADFNFGPGKGGQTRVELSLGGRFSRFKLPRGAARAPRLEIQAAFLAPGQLQDIPKTVSTVIDLAETLKEAALVFKPSHFAPGSSLVYKGELSLDLPPGDYNVELSLRDKELGISNLRTLHLIVPTEQVQDWRLSDLRVLLGVGERLDEQGKTRRVMDPNPWREVGGESGWGLIVAYKDLGPRPTGDLLQKHRVRLLRGEEVAWSQAQAAPVKKAAQSWLVNVPAQTVAAWRPGVYVLEVELSSKSQPQQTIRGSKTFEVQP